MSDRLIREWRRGEIDEQDRDHDAERNAALGRVYRHGGYRQRKIGGGSGGWALNGTALNRIVDLADIACPRPLRATNHFGPVHRHTDNVE